METTKDILEWTKEDPKTRKTLAEVIILSLQGGHRGVTDPFLLDESVREINNFSICPLVDFESSWAIFSKIRLQKVEGVFKQVPFLVPIESSLNGLFTREVGRDDIPWSRIREEFPTFKSHINPFCVTFNAGVKLIASERLDAGVPPTSRFFGKARLVEETYSLWMKAGDIMGTKRGSTGSEHTRLPDERSSNLYREVKKERKRRGKNKKKDPATTLEP